MTESRSLCYNDENWKGERKMKYVRKRWLAALLAAAMVFMTGCGEKFDASGYVQAVLDTVTRCKTEKYAELTKISEKEAEKQYESSIDMAAEEFGKLGFSDELQSKYREYAAALMERTRYETGEAREEKKGFLVDVEVTPILVFEGVKESVPQKIQEYSRQIQDTAMKNQAVPSDEEITEQIGRILYEALNGTLENVAYGEKRTVTVHVRESKKENIWEIPQEELKKLCAELLDTSGAEAVLNLDM